MALGMGAHHLQLTSEGHRAVTADEIVIAYPPKTATAMSGFQILHRQLAVFARCRAMNDDVINYSHDD